MTQACLREWGSSQSSLVLITGATGGLGKAFAVECASRGWNLFLTDLDPQALDTLADGLRKSYGVTVVPRACDLTEAPARAELFGWIKGHGLRFWGLINVAGTDFEGPFFEQSSQQIRTDTDWQFQQHLTHDLRHHYLPNELAALGRDTFQEIADVGGMKIA